MEARPSSASALSYRTIVVPTDFAPASRAALDWAIDLAERCGARVIVLHVTTPIESDPYSPLRHSPEAHAGGQRPEVMLMEHLDRFVAGARERAVDVTVVQQRGIAVAPAILTFAREVDAQLVVMGTHGRHGLGRVLLGSVAERVVRHSHVPVLTVHAGTRAPHAHMRLLVPVDFGPAVDAQLETARRHGGAEGRIDLLHVVEPLPYTGLYEGVLSPYDLRPSLAARLSALALRLPEHVVSTYLIDGYPAREIIAFAERNGTDLIVLGAEGRSGFERFMIGSVAERVARTAGCAVLTLPVRDAERAVAPSSGAASFEHGA